MTRVMRLNEVNLRFRTPFSNSISFHGNFTFLTLAEKTMSFLDTELHKIGIFDLKRNILIRRI